MYVKNKQNRKKTMRNRPINFKETKANSSYGTCDEVGRAKSLYGMSSSKILRANRLI